MDIQTILIALPPLLISVILHEIAHAWVAEKLGDPTARNLNRINLNPLVHIDLFMTIILPTMLILAHSPVVFGGAKPVPVNPRYFKNPRKGMMLVAVAGPIVNLILAVICYLGILIFGKMLLLAPENSPKYYELLAGWLVQGLFINVVLAVFNMFPIPPLDGGRIMVGLLPEKAARVWARLEPYGFFIVFGLLYIKAIDAVLIPVLRFSKEMITLALI